MIAAAVPLSPATADPPDVTVAVVGNHLVNAAGRTIRLLGVDRSGTEYACEQGWGIFDGPSDAASVAAMAAWHINAVRIPLNEGCWLDEYTSANDPYAQFGNPAPYEGAAYQSAIGTYVALLHTYGISAILDLHALDSPDGLGVPPMADSTYSPTFWSSVATYFENDPGVIFDVYNEPHSISWSCWKSGCTVNTSHGSYQAAGMQQLVDAVRATGANQPIMLGGLGWSSDESSWQSSMPTDPDHSLVVSFHTYDGSGCNTLSCWSSTVAPLAAEVPVVTGEFGEYDSATTYSNAYMQFADAEGISYLGWTWDAIAPGGWQCDSPSLITDYDGTPSPEGAALHTHLLALAGGGTPPTVTKVSPASGPGGGDTKVTIKGTKFQGATAVNFGTVAAASYTVNAPGTSITAYTPSEPAGTVDVTVAAGGATSATGASDQFTFLPPVITKVSPNHGPTAGGTKVTLHGTSLLERDRGPLRNSARRELRGEPAGSSITAYAPSEAAGTADVTVTTPGGTSSVTAVDQFSFLAATITKLSPTSGPAAGGTKVTIRGSRLPRRDGRRLRNDGRDELHRERRRNGHHRVHARGDGRHGRRHGQHADGDQRAGPLHVLLNPRECLHTSARDACTQLPTYRYVYFVFALFGLVP